MTTTLMKYILRGVLRGVEDYEAFLDKEAVDPRGKLAEILPEFKTPNTPPSPQSEKIDLDDLLGDITFEKR